MSRFVAIQTGGPSSEAQVLDTSREVTPGHSYIVCECMHVEDALQVADALNAFPLPDPPK